MIVFLPGNFAGKHGDHITPSVIFNMPFMIFPFIACYWLLKEKRNLEVNKVEVCLKLLPVEAPASRPFLTIGGEGSKAFFKGWGKILKTSTVLIDHLICTTYSLFYLHSCMYVAQIWAGKMGLKKKMVVEMQGLQMPPYRFFFLHSFVFCNKLLLATPRLCESSFLYSRVKIAWLGLRGNIVSA